MLFHQAELILALAVLQEETTIPSMLYQKGANRLVNNMYEKLDIALQLINDEVPDESLYNKTIATPSNVVLPEAWLVRFNWQ